MGGDDGPTTQRSADRPFPIPQWTSFPTPPHRVRSVLHVLSSFFHERNEGNEITAGFEEVRDELLDYLHDLDFFENESGETLRPNEFVRTHGLGPILAALKFALYQRNISNPGGFLRSVVEGGDTGRLHPFVRQRLRGYVRRFARWLCDEEAALLGRWGVHDGDPWSTAKGDKLRDARLDSGPAAGMSGRAARGRIGSPSCICHDSYNEAYFRDHQNDMAVGAR